MRQRVSPRPIRRRWPRRPERERKREHDEEDEERERTWWGKWRAKERKMRDRGRGIYFDRVFRVFYIL